MPKSQQNDQKILNGALLAEKHASACFNAAAAEAVTPNVRQQLLSMLIEQQDTSNRILTEMQKRGWISVPAATARETRKRKQAFES